MLGALGVCLSLAAAPGVPPRFVPVRAFTLAWTHSIEKIRWEEDYTVRSGPDGRPVLVPGQARILGSGAGMEPPPDATLRPDGWYVYQPRTGPLDELRLSRSPYTADYDWCAGGRCEPMRGIMPTDGDVTLLRPCRAPREAAGPAAARGAGTGPAASLATHRRRSRPQSPAGAPASGT